MSDAEILALWEQGKLDYGDSKDINSPVQPWLRTKLKELGWNQKKLAEMMTEVSGIKTHDSAIGNIMNRRSRLGADLASRIATAMSVSEDVLFSLAGLRKQPPSQQDSRKAEIVLLYDNLDSSHQKLLVDYARYLIDKTERLNHEDKTPKKRKGGAKKDT
jgi:plasmid maintenance system antidote protein VapI